MTEFEIRRPDDWHVHLRDGAALKNTVADMSRYFGRAIIMPNLTPPVRSVKEAGEYRQRILEAGADLPRCIDPLMVLYLTDNTRPEDIKEAAASGFVKAVKWYPAGATTNSDAGVTQPEKLGPVFETLQAHGLPLLIHGEVTDHDIDIFDREAEFISRYMRPLVSDYPNLKVVFEHITTADAAEFVAQASDNVAATITAHHLLYNRNDMLVGGIRPHYFCLPILKRNRHQKALIDAATSGSPKFFLGTDSAPHPVGKKETDCGCAGCYTAHAAIELYALAFEHAGALDKLEAFASENGPRFYGLPLNEDRITLKKQAWQSPDRLQLGDDEVHPLTAGQSIDWQVVG